MVKLAAEQHAFTHRTHGAGLAPSRDLVHVVVIVAHTGGVIGISAGRIHAEQSFRVIARRARLTHLGVAVASGERLTWGEERISYFRWLSVTFSPHIWQKNVLNLNFTNSFLFCCPSHTCIFDMSPLSFEPIYLK